MGEIPRSLDEGGRLSSAGQGAVTARRVARWTVVRSGGDGWVARATFLSITRRGIVIVTVSDGQVYSKETIKENWTKLIVALAIMSRANEESATKSKRAREVIQTRLASNVPLALLREVRPDASGGMAAVSVFGVGILAMTERASG